MNKIYRYKKLILLFVCLLLFLIIIPMTYVLFIDKSAFNKNVAPGEFTKEINQKNKEIKTGLVLKQVDSALQKINDSTLPEAQRYEALKQLSFYYSTAYSATHNPVHRETADFIKNFAKKTHPKLYEEIMFNVPCADPSCGEKIEGELAEIKKMINEIKMPAEDLNTINKNFETAAYTPEDRGFEKRYGFSLVIAHLYFLGINEASISAKKLDNYVKSKNYPSEL